MGERSERNTAYGKSDGWYDPDFALCCLPKIDIAYTHTLGNIGSGTHQPQLHKSL